MSFNVKNPAEFSGVQNLVVDGHTQLVDVSCTTLDVGGTAYITGTTTVGNTLQIGLNDNSTTAKSIRFGGVSDDNDYEHSVIETRNYGDTAKSELLLFKGDNFSSGGPDRIRLRAAQIDFDTYSSNSTDRTAENIRMTINSSGYIGIGKTNPTCTLDIARIGSNASQVSTQGRYIFHNNEGVLGPPNSFSDVVVKSEGDVICNGAIGSYSDERIKTNILDISDSSALDKLRLLKPKTYNYLDTIIKGNETVYGFIAQEVGEVVPKSTIITRDKIPNIYQVADVCNNQLILQNQFTLEYDASNQLYKTLYLYDENDLMHNVEIIDFSNQIITISGEITGNQMFVYGQEVDNLHVLKKEAIWTIATAALQEVDRQLQAEKEKVSTLETQYNDLLARIEALENK